MQSLELHLVALVATKQYFDSPFLNLEYNSSIHRNGTFTLKSQTDLSDNPLIIRQICLISLSEAPTSINNLKDYLA